MEMIGGTEVLREAPKVVKAMFGQEASPATSSRKRGGAKAIAAPAPPKAPPKALTYHGPSCAICLSPAGKSALACELSPEHLVCRACAGPFVRSELERVNESDALLAEHRQRDGRLRCALHSSSPACPSFYADQALAKILDAASYGRYQEEKAKVPRSRSCDTPLDRPDSPTRAISGRVG